MANVKYLIVGLGNPGQEYEKTRHNVGFMVLDNLAKKLEAGEFRTEKRVNGEIVKTKIGERDAILLKPQTYMNLSGEALKSTSEYYKIENQNTIVISDDVNLELGQVRIRFSGEAGGHKGLSSVIGSAGQDFWRVRIGIGQNSNIPMEDFVLQRFTNDEQAVISQAIDKTSTLLVESITKDKLENITTE
ncbi:aminoacyl-tRNA hydrolase [Patescibacteria group bacterium]|nr:aminoacyl-tRNA hydrolase [Patescibacteria group bacterium]